VQDDELNLKPQIVVCQNTWWVQKYAKSGCGKPIVREFHIILVWKRCVGGFKY